MKPLDLQTAVGKSQEGARLSQPRDRPNAAGEQAVHDFRRDLERKNASVAQLERADTTRIEDGEAGGTRGRRESPSREKKMGKHDKPDSEKDPQKGRIIDITIGFLALAVFVMLY
jgi:sRNA-binding protein